MKKAKLINIYWIIICIGVSISLLSVGCSTNAKSIKHTSLILAGNKIERISIVLPEEPVKDESFAAGELKDYLRKISPVSVSIVKENSWNEGPSIHVGRTRYVESLGLRFDNLDLHGYIIKTVGANLVLAGREPYGTQFAVYGFLQDYLGVRWFMPGELGVVVPRPELLEIDNIDRIEEPDFLSRQYSGLARPEGKIWAKRMRMQRRFRFHHNLGKIIIPSKYGKDHPEYFPLIKGKRYIPPSDKAHKWQPCFSNKDVVEIVAQAAIDFFKKHPNEISFHLGVNDGKGYCKCKNCLSMDVIGYDRSIGRRNYSDRVFAFMNAVAEKVEKVYPDKYLGCLAYLCTEKPPERVTIHPMIIPYLTNDRAQWMHSDFKEKDKKLIKAWTEAAKTVGIYDYYYGWGYVIPRFYPHHIEESLKYSYEVGVKGFYAEAYPNWGLDGPKLYLAARLLWDTNLNVDDLLEEYYSKFFGGAELPMRKFFSRIEEIYTSQKGPGKWLKDKRKPLEQLELFHPGVVTELTQLLNEAYTNAQESIVKERIKFIQDTFKYTELNSKMYHVMKELKEIKPTSISFREKSSNIKRESQRLHEIRERLLKRLTKNDALYYNTKNLLIDSD